jgi:phospholipase/carboxylesterase
MTTFSRPTQVRFGSLDCYAIDGGPKPSIPVVICHGYGAPGTDLVGLAADWIDRLGASSERFRFVFPAAPNDLRHLGMPGGRAWWPLNMAQLAEKMESDRFEDLHDLEPDGLASARDKLVETIAAVQADLAAPVTRLVLGGFSQGAMLTMETSLRGLASAPELLIQFSGTLICKSAWKSNLGKLASTQVFQSHGTRDPILPFTSAMALRDLLASSKVRVDFHAFDGPHTIDEDALEKSSKLLSALP